MQKKTEKNEFFPTLIVSAQSRLETIYIALPRPEHGGQQGQGCQQVFQD